MRGFPANISSILRAGFLALLVLGLVAKPMLNQLSGMHALEHAALAAAGDHGHDHGDGHDHPTGADHVKGAHVLMHQADTGSSAAPWSPELVSSIHPLPQTLPVPESGLMVASRLTLPFRPPIA